MTTVHEDGGDIARLTVKRKRTKRQRAASPPAAAGELSGEREEEAVREMVGESTEHVEGAANEEDEDMAKCLMLLAQGRRRNGDHRQGSLSNKKAPPPSSSASPQPGLGLGLGLGLEGVCVYQCKTCEKSFPSFQALGGHRASHKKPKNGPNPSSGERKSAFAVGENGESDQSVLGRFLSLQVTSNSSKKPDKIHECSICKAEFSSGQALGGHMRRHRSVPNATATADANANAAVLNNVGDSESSSDRIDQESKRQRNLLQLDLNLPAPEDDRSDKPKFAFASKDQILVFAATSNSLVDCHY